MNGAQGEFGFAPTGDESGFNAWHEQRQVALRRFAYEMGLPLGHRVRLTLMDGIELSGMLRLKEERLFFPEERDFKLELTVDGVSFTATEIQSCVRTD